MTKRLPAATINSALNSAIEEAQLLEPQLSERLHFLKRRIKSLTPGNLLQKRILLDFLTEVIEDSKLWLTLKASTLDEQKQILNQMTTSERYWYEFLFPVWFSQFDQKLSNWIGELKKGNFERDDEALVNALSEKIEDQERDCYWGFILDLSMATDLIVGNRSGLAVCAQLTTVNKDFAEPKKDSWELTLRYWKIERGLFVSFNPSGNYGDVTNLAEFLLRKGDDLLKPVYIECYI